jgi:hypothetical protein
MAQVVECLHDAEKKERKYQKKNLCLEKEIHFPSDCKGFLREGLSQGHWGKISGEVKQEFLTHSHIQLNCFSDMSQSLSKLIKGTIHVKITV